MKHRKLRIAWSVAWGVVAVLLGVLWVRSYWVRDALHQNSDPYNVSIASASGVIQYAQYDNLFGGNDRSWFFESGDIVEPTGINMVFGWFTWQPDDNFKIRVAVPWWFIAGVATVVGLLPWLPGRYSLRTLLIATTLVAAG